MYRQFCKNLKNYLDINKPDSYRYKMGEEIAILSDLKLYNKLKKSNDREYKRISNFIYELSKLTTENPTVKKFIWELWAYGFEIKKFEDVEKGFIDKADDMKEKIKLIDLLLGTHYWN